MNKENYKMHLLGVIDKVRGKIIHIGADDSRGGYARSVIPQYKEMYPLNDLEIIDMGIINPFSGKIEQEEVTHHDWKKLYKFEITNKAVHGENEVTNESDKQ